MSMQIQMWECFTQVHCFLPQRNLKQINHSRYTSAFSTILSWGNKIHTQTDELKSKQHKINAYIDQWHGLRAQAKLGIWITIISKHFTATELSLGTKNNNMLMNYKSAKNHKHILNSKFSRKWCFAKTCTIRAVTRNIHMQQVIGNISCFNHKRAG